MRKIDFVVIPPGMELFRQYCQKKRSTQDLSYLHYLHDDGSNVRTSSYVSHRLKAVLWIDRNAEEISFEIDVYDVNAPSHFKVQYFRF